jgi:arginase
MTATTIDETAIGTSNRLTAAPVRPIEVPLWLGAERPGVELAPAALAAGLRRRWTERERPALLARLAPGATIPVPTPPDAASRLHRRSLEFLPEVTATCRSLAEEVAAAIEAGALALSLGGDHALSVGSIAGAARAAGRDRLGVLWIDTHPDLNTPETSPSGHLHGMALAAALGLGAPALAGPAAPASAVAPEDVCLLGVRDLDPGERRLIRERGMWALTMEEWTDAGLLRGLAGALTYLESRGVGAVHLSFDLDVLDPRLLPGTGTTVAGGLTYREASQVLRRLREWDGPIRSLDWVELNPALDAGGWSTETAVALLATVLGETMR